jgi:molybdopterin-containing oxidoreductase family iron-sulfur binding subunit
MSQQRRSDALAGLRARVAGARGPDYWRSLEELADAPEFQELIQDEFPAHASEWHDPVGRRAFLKVMAASLALGGLTACSRPTDTILPYAVPPEEVVPGKPLFFATAMTLGGYATGLLVESHTGRPTKVEGNPSHPASLGATDAFSQAAILALYDPDRSQAVLRGRTVSTWEQVAATLAGIMEVQRAGQGAGLRVLTETVTSPTLAAQLRTLLSRYPSARWHQYEPAGDDAIRAGTRLAFGEVLNPVYRLDRAAVIVSLGGDLLNAGPAAPRYARDFSAGRRLASPGDGMNRLYVAEPMPTPTGAIADHRLPVRASDMERFARGLAQRLRVEAAGGEEAAEAFPQHARWLDAVARDLQAHRGTSLVVAGRDMPPMVHVLAHAMNQALGNLGQTVLLSAPVEAQPVDQLDSLRTLTADMDAGKVEVLIILGGNPVYTAPADVGFENALAKVGLRVHLAEYDDETSAQCHWHIPETHFLEAWGDARAFDGTVSLVQPLIAPLAAGRRSAIELMGMLLGQSQARGYEILREHWRNELRAPDFESAWRKALHDGVIAGTALPVRSAGVRAGATARPGQAPAAAPAGGTLEIVFRPDPTVWDGRFANNAWLQELPKPLTKLTWGNAAYLSPATAARLGIQSGDVVEVAHGGRTLRVAAWVQPGHAADSVTLHLGYGRRRAGRVGTALGANAYLLRTAEQPWVATGVEVRKTGERVELAATQLHHTLAGRHHMRAGTLEEYQKHPEFAKEMVHAPHADLYPEYPYEGYAWGMAIDLTACMACNACVVACQAENNIPVVGREQVIRSREMHWLRIDSYYAGDAEDPTILPQPMLCQHCEKAPCEPVCPVAATSHSAEGLNDQIYNRCVGTRYCSNNCPYKVRRFNFLKYSTDQPLLQLVHNPDVTVRSRGVMEKCTYCVQRINAARIDAKREDRPIRDGDVVTACQAACPTGAITFGNINDRASRVFRLKQAPRNYGALEELNTRPRTSYLARIRNVNPEIEAA